MKIHAVHTREVPVAADTVGALLDRLLEVQPLGKNRSQLTHTLMARLEAKMLPVYPILIRQHDALAEDLLDRAELVTTRRISRPARWPTSVRIANAVELAIARRREMLPAPPRASHDRLTRVCGLAVPGILLGLAALHASWALGSYWPAASRAELAGYVLSRRERDRLRGELPHAAVTWGVALSLAAAAALVRAAASGVRPRALRGAAWAVAAMFLGRGVAYLPSDLIGGPDDPYRRLDLALYAPLCLGLAAGTAIVLREEADR